MLISDETGFCVRLCLPINLQFLTVIIEALLLPIRLILDFHNTSLKLIFHVFANYYSELTTYMSIYNSDMLPLGKLGLLVIQAVTKLMPWIMMPWNSRRVIF